MPQSEFNMPCCMQYHSCISNFLWDELGLYMSRVCDSCAAFKNHLRPSSSLFVQIMSEIEPNTNSQTKITVTNTGMLILHIDTSTTNLHQLLSLTAVVAVLLGANIPYLFTCGVKNSHLGTTTMLA
jgi:hypothetical protein